jgi:hypothetical protein
MEGNGMAGDIPHIENAHVLGMVVEEPIPLIDGKEGIKGTPCWTVGLEI